MKKQTVSKIVLKFLIVATLFISLILTNPIQAHALASTYYVSTTGNDANNGLSLNTPFRTIQKSASISKAGDTIEIQPGAYNEQITITRSGLVNQLITFHANGQVIIDAQNTRQYGIKIDGADYIKIEGFTIRNAKDNGILLTNNANYNISQTNTCYNNGASGIRLYASVYNTISNNTCYSNGYGTSAYGDRPCGIYLYASSNYNTLDGNTCRHNPSTGIWLEGSSSYCAIKNNKTYSNGYGGIIVVGGANYNAISYNLIYSNGQMGIDLSYSAHDNIFKNNTIYNNGTNGIQSNNSGYSNYLKNNIIVNNGLNSSYAYGISIAAGCSAASTYNDVYNNGQGGNRNYYGLSSGIGDISINPQFKSTDSQNGNFLKLKSKNTGDGIDSPCIDFGDPQDKPTLETTPRCDIGAHDMDSAYGNKNLIAEWRLDENTGAKAKDTTSNQNHGAIYGAAFNSGISGSSLFFDGIDDYVKIQDSQSLNSTKAITLEAWIKIIQYPQDSCDIITKYNSGVVGSYLLTVRNDGKVLFSVESPWSYILSNQTISPNDWHQIIAVFSAAGGSASGGAGIKSIYIDGKLDNQNQGGGLSIHPTPVLIGARFCGGSPACHFKGQIDEARIYQRALTANEVLSAYNKIDITPPTVPTIKQIISPTNINTQNLSGTKEPNTSILINRIERVPLDSLTTWAKIVHLSEATNNFSITSKDTSGNESQAVLLTIFLDTTPPAIPAINTITSPTNVHAQTITGIKSQDTSLIILTCPTAKVWGINYPTATTWSCQLTNLTEGANNLTVKAKDLVGNESAATAAILLDTTLPAGTIKINNDAQYTKSTVVTLNLSAQDTASGMDKMRFSSDANNWSEAEPYTAEKTWTLTGADGEKTVYVKYSDKAGNQSAPINDTIILDTTAPIITITSPQNGFASSAQTITVEGAIDDNNAAVTINGAVAAVIPAQAGIQATFFTTVTLVEGDNSITAHATDQAGNTSTVQINIICDTTPPTTPQVTDDGDYTQNLTQLRVSWTSSDTETGIAEYQYSIGTTQGATDVLDWTTAGVKTEITHDGLNLTNGQIYYINVQAKNKAGLWSQTGTSDGITIDPIAPDGTIKINNDAVYTASTSVTLNLSAADAGSGMGTGRMKFSNNGADWSSAEAYATTKSWTLPTADGEKTVYVKYSDKAGNESAPINDTIILDTTAPIITITSPQNGFVSSAQTITVEGAIDDSTAAVKITTTNGTNETTYPAAVANNTFIAQNIPITSIPVDQQTTITAHATDQAGNTSTVQINIICDTTPPTTPQVTDDGDYTQNLTQIRASWTSSDTETGIVEYQYSIGTTQGATDVLDWTTAGVKTEITHDGLNLTNGQIYYINVQAKNKAGLWSGIGTTNGIIADNCQTLLIKIIEPKDNTQTNTAQINIEGTINNSAATVTVNGIAASSVIPAQAGIHATFTAQITLTDGENQITATAVTQGQTATDEIIIYLDTTPPTITVFTPDENATTQSSIIYGRVSFDTASVIARSDTDEAISAELLTANENYQYFIAEPLLTEGQNTITIAATDAAGNATSKTHTFIYNTTEPKITITNPQNNSFTNLSPLTIEGAIADDITYCYATSAGLQNGTIENNIFTVENLKLTPNKAVITVTGFDENENKYQDAIIISTPDLKHYELIKITGDANEYDDEIPQAGANQDLTVKLYRNNAPAQNEEIIFSVERIADSEEESTLFPPATPSSFPPIPPSFPPASQQGGQSFSGNPEISVYTDINGEASATLTTDTNSDVTNIVECFPTQNSSLITQFSIDTKSGAPYSLQPVNPPTGSPAPGAQIPLIVKLTDEHSNPIQDEQINFAITQGQGLLSLPGLTGQSSNVQAVTNYTGTAQIIFTASATPETQTIITAQSNTNPQAATTFTVTTSALLTVSVEDLFNKVDLNAQKIQDQIIEITMTSDDPDETPQSQYKIWQKDDLMKIQDLSTGETQVRPQLSIGATSAAGAQIINYNSQTSIYLIKTKDPAQSGEYPYTLTYIDSSKAVITKIETYYETEGIITLFTTEMSGFIQLPQANNAWVYNTKTEKVYDGTTGSTSTTTMTVTNRQVNTGLTQSDF